MNPLLTNGTTLPRPPAALTAPIADDLEEVERILTNTMASKRPHVAKLVAHLGHYRGKRLRPILLLLTARACGKVAHAHHVLAAVVEMIHTATLVHDDVLDNASVRRHVPTVNARWDNQSSILLGDYLFTHAFHLTSTLGDARACEIIGDATNRVCEGELQQIGERGNLAITEEQYFSIIDGKTAELTSCCCRLGAMFAGMSDDAIESLARYGRSLGVAFQIADDLLDLIGEEGKTGKSLGTDLDQQKLTLPLIRLREQASEKVKAQVAAILASPGNHKREQLAPYLAETAAMEYARRRAEEFANSARSELECLPPSHCRMILEMLTSQVVHRSA
jgi:octaprenyl-diphosphate synthase